LINPTTFCILIDLRNIMHAFGDDCMPLEESVHLMEVILRQEMKAFLFICDQAAELRGTKILGLRECIYAMKSDKSNLSRLFKYLSKNTFCHDSLRYCIMAVYFMLLYCLSCQGSAREKEKKKESYSKYQVHSPHENLFVRNQRNSR